MGGREARLCDSASTGVTVIPPAPKPARSHARRRTTHAARKDAERRLEAIVRAEVYRAVDLRDRGSCRLCGAFSAQHHHHHLVYRSRGGADATCNVILCCPSCHSDIHAARVRVTGDADARDASGLLAGLTIARRPPEGWL